MYDTAITFRTNSKTKRQAQKLFSNLGMDTSTALNIFLKKSLQTGGIPFEVTTEQPNHITLAAIDDAMNDNNMSGPYESVDDLMEALDAED
ncbi:type II toxin-antitoxin system RelB/DinJ family antitoxin [Candidatus Saccharibacteria bacterium]|nr:type II toxin-antitoxin system RelB/DinJ family antitoxin [Candidatus Saccharibacteria bacterium]